MMQFNDMSERREGDIEIDLKELFYTFRKRLWLLLLSLFIGVLAAAGYTYFLVTPLYSATSMLYILNTRSEDGTSLSDLQAGAQLTEDYKVLIISRPILDQVKENLGLPMEIEQLQKYISVTNPTNSRVIEITVKHSQAVRARDIANEIAGVTIEQLKELTGTDIPNILGKAVQPKAPVSPRYRRNCLFGGLGGVLFTAIVIATVFIFNDKIRSEEDLEKYLGLNTLAAIPVSEANKKNSYRTAVNYKRKRRKAIKRGQNHE